MLKTLSAKKYFLATFFALAVLEVAVPSNAHASPSAYSVRNSMDELIISLVDPGVLASMVFAGLIFSRKMILREVLVVLILLAAPSTDYNVFGDR